MSKAVKWLLDKIAGSYLKDFAAFLWCAIGGVVTTIAQSTYSWWTGHPNVIPLVIGAVTVVIFSVAAVIVAIVNKSTTRRVPGMTPPPHGLQSISDFPALSNKLNIEILEGFIGLRKENMISSPEAWILLKVRVASRRDPSVMIKEWSAEKFRCHDAELVGDMHINTIPDGFRYVLPGSTSEQSVGPGLDEKTAKIPLSFGSHEVGFILLRTHVYDLHQSFRYSFALKAIDSLDGISRCYQPPGEWLRPAELIWPSGSQAEALVESIS